MTYRAVLFDLYGTLVFDKFSSKAFPPFQAGQASLLGLQEEEFIPLWNDSFQDRVKGKFQHYQENFIWIARSLGKQLDPAAVEEAAENMVEFTRQSLRIREGALDVLNQLRAIGVKTGLLSDCGPACPVLWKETPMSPLFDCATFSCLEKTKKPDPRFYQTALDRLGIPASECLYVGDGHGQELTGAKRMGMRPVQIYSAIGPDEPDRLVVKDWEGTTIQALSEVLNLLG